MQKTNFFILVLFAGSVLAFWFVEKATAYRISSLVYFILVGSYGIILRRTDVFAASTLFFGLYSLNQYLFDQLLPAWIGILGAALLVMILWWSAFRLEHWITALAVTILVSELMVISQYTIIDARWQALLITVPFLVAFQQIVFDGKEEPAPSVA